MEDRPALGRRIDREDLARVACDPRRLEPEDRQIFGIELSSRPHGPSRALLSAQKLLSRTSVTVLAELGKTLSMKSFLHQPPCPPFPTSSVSVARTG